MAHIADDGTIVHHSLPPAVFADLYAIPYWSLILPLTLLSAYLILWPKQKRSGNSVQDR